MTPYQSHVAKWKDCRRCELCSQRSRIVLFRGQVPCEVLFVGEAPGMSEDALGQPFKGPAGQLLDQIVGIAWANLTDYQAPGPRVGFTNLVACFPREAKETDNHAPPDDAIKACRPRFVEIVRICKPKLIVLVGKLAQKNVIGASTFSLKEDSQPEWIADDKVLEFVEIEHPAAILRSNQAVQGLKVKKCVVAIQSAVRSLMKGEVR